VFIKLIQIFVLFYVGLLAVLYIYQRNLIYFPDTKRPQPVAGAQIVNVTTADDFDISAWYFPPKTDDKPVLVYFHGNAGHYGHRISKIMAYLDAGYGVLLAEYRGFGGNPGKFSEEGFYRDGRAYMDWVIKANNIPADKLVIYGESVGSGIAVQMATEYDIAALILETPFSSLLELAQQRYPYVPIKLMLKDSYMNIQKIGRIHVPLLILHGHKDSIVPFSQGQKLHAAANSPKTLIDFPQANHNDIYSWGADMHVLEFLAGFEDTE